MQLARSGIIRYCCLYPQSSPPGFTAIFVATFVNVSKESTFDEPQRSRVFKDDGFRLFYPPLLGLMLGILPESRVEWPSAEW